LIALAGCTKAESTSSVSCGLTEDGGALDISNRVDGLYGVVDDRVGATPMARFEHMARTGSGVGPDGKTWVGVRFEGDEARTVQEFTASPPGRAVVGVLGGAVVFRHKIRVPIRSADTQVSCCNPQYCDRWEALLKSDRDGGARR
jgi:preprotein translocase subunit SecD